LELEESAILDQSLQLSQWDTVGQLVLGTGYSAEEPSTLEMQNRVGQ
jgi:hypothetical protein